MAHEHPVDVAVVGAGAAGLFAALAASGALMPDGSFGPAEGRRVVLLDGQAQPGRKILVSGGGRCNVTNAAVSERDFVSERPRVVRNVLREFPPTHVRRFFEGRGVPLQAEPLGKLFPRVGRARDVLGALLDAAAAAGVETRFGRPVESVEPAADGWLIDRDLLARRLIVATGGRSIPKTGSTGWGYGFATEQGHRVVPPVPALAPLTVRTPTAPAGLTLPATLTVEDADGRALARATGSLLFTHRGVSGPAALDVSHAVERHAGSRVVADFWGPASPDGAFGDFLGGPKFPGACLPEAMSPADPAELERTILATARDEPRTALGALLSRRLPRRLVRAVVAAHETTLAQLTRDQRREAARAVTRLDLGATGSEGFAKAEVTAGGVDLAEVDRRTFESRLAPGLHFCGEVLDATGRLGGFNFQWAWASGFLAGRGTHRPPPPVPAR